MEGTKLTGLEGTNPLGFLAALGVQTVFQSEKHQPRLWWTDDVIPHAMVDSDYEVGRLVDQALYILPNLCRSAALNPGIDKKADHDAKFKQDQIRPYLAQSQSCQYGSSLASAIVAEGSLDRNGVAKPSDLYFAAGRILFLDLAKTVLEAANAEALNEALVGPWRPHHVSSLGWDMDSYIPYALAATKPGTGKKRSYPGVEALALLGMSRHPVFLGRDRTLTRGCSGSWKRGLYTWPVWTRPAGYGAVSSLLAQTSPSALTDRTRWYSAWGISQVFQSQIRRTDQGGYGAFGPPQIIWRAN